MNLRLELRPNLHCPPPVGAHELAWSYMLDYVYADAYRERMSELHVIVPTPALVPALELRSELSGNRAGTGASGQVLLVGGQAEPGATRVYRLAPGRLAPRAWRTQERQPLAGRRLTRTLFVYTLKARLLGLPMRLSNLSAAPYWADRALVAVRHSFASERPCSAYYELETWC